MNKSLLRSTLALSVIAAMSSATQANEPSATVQNNVTKLETIVVTTAGGFEQNIADAPASISVISAEELQKKSYTDVIDAVK
ncbi:MAG: TonB-dependent receptor, partial [Acinetobacter sp.]|nr:TonB-dependent receptor [Acinetobacter sp.]